MHVTVPVTGRFRYRGPGRFGITTREWRQWRRLRRGRCDRRRGGGASMAHLHVVAW